MSEWVSSGEGTQPIPDAWRPVLRDVVHALVSGDYALARAGARIQPVDTKTADQLERSVADHGETLVELPDAAWDTAFTYRVTDQRWDIVVELWTAECGRSDMVLEGWFDGPGPEAAFSLRLVYVPQQTVASSPNKFVESTSAAAVRPVYVESRFAGSTVVRYPASMQLEVARAEVSTPLCIFWLAIGVQALVVIKGQFVERGGGHGNGWDFVAYLLIGGSIWVVACITGLIMACWARRVGLVGLQLVAVVVAILTVMTR